MVVQGRGGDLQFGRHVGVAEAVEAPDLHQSLGDVQNPGRRPRCLLIGSHYHSVPLLQVILDNFVPVDDKNFTY